MDFVAAAHTIMERCAILATFSEEPGCLTRPYGSPSMQHVNEIVGGWMREAGMHVEIDAIGNLIGRYEAMYLQAQTLLLGSHLDSVRDAGKYDGPLGVLTALACVELLHARGERLPFAIEITGFCDEEGLRYHYSYLGSRAVTGTFDPTVLSLTDANGITVADAIRAQGGNPDPTVLCTPRWQRDQLLGYCEVHIEQGPVLEARHLPVAAVSAINGQSRFSLDFRGEAGHAGTVPMELRHDALCAAAEFMLAIEALARGVPGLVATVGQISVSPGASNVIPGKVVLSLEVRSQDDGLREDVCRQLHERASTICTKRKIGLSWQSVQEDRTITCAPRLVQLLKDAIAEAGYATQELPSGAGHDAVIMSRLTDVAMLFVRCRAGISHNPAEAVTSEDVAVAVSVLMRFVQRCAQSHPL